MIGREQESAGAPRRFILDLQSSRTTTVTACYRWENPYRVCHVWKASIYVVVYIFFEWVSAEKEGIAQIVRLLPPFGTRLDRAENWHLRFLPAAYVA